MSEQPINQWNMTTEPSDMMKINTPMPITVAPSRSEKSDDMRTGTQGYANVGFRVVRTDR